MNRGSWVVLALVVSGVVVAVLMHEGVADVRSSHPRASGDSEGRPSENRWPSDHAGRQEVTPRSGAVVWQPRSASVSLVHLPSQDQQSPIGSGLRGWQLFYEGFRVDGTLSVGPGFVWWTEDPDLVRVFVNQFEESLPQTVQLQSEYRRQQTAGEAHDTGLSFLESTLRESESEIGALALEYSMFQDAGLSSTHAAELGAFLRAQALARGGKEIGQYSMFGPFGIPLEQHLLQERGVKFSGLTQAEQTYLLEAYSQTLVDAAALRVRYLELEGAGVVAASDLGLPYADLETQLANALPELNRLREDVESLWESFQADLSR